jgi:anti-sigma B factor antagonist
MITAPGDRGGRKLGADAVLTQPRQGSVLQIRLHRPEPGTIVFALAGDLDASTVPRLEAALLPRLSSTARTVVLDLAGVSFLGVAGLRLLLRAHTRATATGQALRIVVRTHQVRRLFAVTGADRALRCHTTVEYALLETRLRLR